jgi:ribonuclease BN (tRNA processing enzyme)
MRTVTVAAVSMCVAAFFAFTTGSFAQVQRAYEVPANQSVFVTLGTQSGPIPSVARAQPANVVMWRDEVILVDAGDGVVEQLTKAGVPLGAVDAVLISHLHFDHIGGLFALLGRRYQAMHPGAVIVYGPPGIKSLVDGLLAGMQPSFDLIRRPDLVVSVREVSDGARFSLGEATVTVAANSHYRARFKEGSPEDMRFQSLSFRFDLPDRSLVYTGDTGPSENVARLARNVDVLICEVMDPVAALENIRRSRPDVAEASLASVEQHFAMEHLSPAQAGRLAQQAHARRLVLTHIGGVTDREQLAAMREAIAREYRGPIAFAEDLDRF